jgi:hypothetical protein
MNGLAISGDTAVVGEELNNNFVGAVVRLGRQLPGRRVLHGPLWAPASVRDQRAERHLAQRDRGPGTGALNKGGNAVVASVSCASAGHCLVGGSYQERSGNTQAFVASQT